MSILQLFTNLYWYINAAGLKKEQDYNFDLKGSFSSKNNYKRYKSAIFFIQGFDKLIFATKKKIATKI